MEMITVIGKWTGHPYWKVAMATHRNPFSATCRAVGTMVDVVQTAVQRSRFCFAKWKWERRFLFISKVITTDQKPQTPTIIPENTSFPFRSNILTCYITERLLSLIQWWCKLFKYMKNDQIKLWSKQDSYRWQQKTINLRLHIRLGSIISDYWLNFYFTRLFL